MPRTSVPLTARPDYQAGDGGRPNLSKGQMIGFVFAFVADVHPRWHTDVLEAQLTSGTVVADGTTFTNSIQAVHGHVGGDRHRYGGLFGVKHAIHTVSVFERRQEWRPRRQDHVKTRPG